MTKPKIEEGTPGRLALGAEKAACWLLYCLAGLVFLFLAANSLLFTSFFPDTSLEVVEYKADTLWLNLLVLALFAVFVVLLYQRDAWRWLTARRLQAALLVFTVVGGAAWVLASGSVAYAEPATIRQYAQAFTEGDFGALGPQRYYAMFPYQLGFTAYVQLFYLLFGGYTDLALQMANVLYAAGCFWLLTGFCRHFFKGRGVAQVCCLLLFGFVCILFFCTFAYGTLPGLFFALWGLCLAGRAFAENRPGLLALAAAPLALAVVLKSNYLIFAVAVVLTGLVYWLRARGALWLGALALVVLAGLGCMQLVYAGYTAASGQSVGKGVPATAWVAMGLDMEHFTMAPGWYNGYTYSSYPDNGYDHDRAAEQAGEMVGEELHAVAEHPQQAARFFYAKTLSQWNEPTMQSVMLGYHAARQGYRRPALVNAIYDGSLTRPGWLAEVLMDKVHLLVYAGAALGLWFGRNRLDLFALLPAMVVVGGFLFHLVWEAKSQYILPYYLLCVPYAALGWASLGRTLAGLWPGGVKSTGGSTKK